MNLFQNKSLFFVFSLRYSMHGPALRIYKSCQILQPRGLNIKVLSNYIFITNQLTPVTKFLYPTTEQVRLFHLVDILIFTPLIKFLCKLSRFETENEIIQLVCLTFVSTKLFLMFALWSGQIPVASSLQQRFQSFLSVYIALV
jgi:hypothetical protein